MTAPAPTLQCQTSEFDPSLVGKWNQANEEHILQDESLFPYSDKLYPLISICDGLMVRFILTCKFSFEVFYQELFRFDVIKKIDVLLLFGPF